MSAAGHHHTNILVIGAGVSGLTTALLLARKNMYNVAVSARNFPGDASSSQFTSPWAAGNVVPVSEKGSVGERWDRESWAEFLQLAHNSPEAGVELRQKTSYVHGRPKPNEPTEWFKDLVENYHFLRKENVPSFAEWGYSYRTFVINPSIYLHYLQRQCIQKGVTFSRGEFEHIRDCFEHRCADGRRPDVVVNCTGLWARQLGGVKDEKVVPVRGQLVIVANDSKGMFGYNGWDSSTESTYIIPRPHGGGTALGGSHHVDDYNVTPDPGLAKRIMERSIQICPSLVKPGEGIEGLQVVAHTVGLRPYRIGGPRIEKDIVDGHLKVVHNYGAGGFGFQSSYGMAGDAAALVDDIVGVNSVL